MRADSASCAALASCALVKLSPSFVTADFELNPRDDFERRISFIDAFRARAADSNGVLFGGNFEDPLDGPLTRRELDEAEGSGEEGTASVGRGDIATLTPAVIGVAVVALVLRAATRIEVGVSRLVFSRSDESLLLTILGMTILVAGAAALAATAAASDVPGSVRSS